ncbi:MAG: alkaline phytoceramidase [Gammaproteobacteria bacterium]|nr:alkaline phytoceramidase [Gammaproteobacteria bacterium]MBU1977709.1 alkaline phytoceramidase [Gammaproteobacteria bacterium]
MRLLLIVLLTGVIAAIIAVLPPFPQPAAYHDFADQRALLGLPNFLNVASNGLFVLVSAAGLRWLIATGGDAAFRDRRERWIYLIFFLGLALTGIASAWYHLNPDNGRLLWDRLAMTIALMSWLAAIIAERIGVAAGLALLPALLAAGAASVLYWGATEALGAGDLRPYGMVHFYPALLIPLLTLLFPPRYTRGGDALMVLGWYAAALGAEHLDRHIFALGGIVGGHTVKHVFAALAAGWVLHMLRLRRPCGPSQTSP